MISHRFIRKHLLNRSVLSDALVPLARVNAFCQKRRRLKAAKRAWHPPCKVISIGNISSGGSGKTPFCIYLAKLLQGEGFRLGISHRGYRGQFEQTPTLVSAGREPLYGVLETGDEAHLLASRLPGIPVVVGRQRKAAVSLLLAAFPETQVVVLDDAFQHLQVARDLDILCFEAETGIGNGRLIPAGYLREPLEAIAPDSLIIINHKDPDTDSGELASLLQNKSEHIFHCFYKVTGLVNPQAETFPVSDLAGKRAMLISGIANPASFERTATAAGINWLNHFHYPDHYAFSDPAQIARIASLAGKYQVDHLVCTEKDLAKLARHPQLEKHLLALRVGLECPASAKLISLIRRRLEL